MKKNFNVMLRLSALIIVISLVFTFFTALAESGLQPEFWNLENALWWWLSSISTVGYGDLVPITPIGKIFASGVIFSSFLILGLIVAEFTYYIKIWTNRSDLGFVDTDSENHIVILGQNAILNILLEFIKLHYPKKAVVIVSNKLDYNPYDDVIFVNGDPKRIETLNRANIINAKLAIILADENINNPDAYTLVISNEIEKINKEVITIGEMSNNDYENIYKKANMDYFILESELIKGISNDKKIAKLIHKALGK